MSDFETHPIGTGSPFKLPSEGEVHYVDDDGKDFKIKDLIADRERYHDALDHIMRIAHMSCQMSKRTYWIAQRAKSALDGDDKWREFDYPKNRVRERDNLRKKLNALRSMVSTSGGLKCPSCDDAGWYPEMDGHGEAEQVQCEFCHTVPDSLFNRRNENANG